MHATHPRQAAELKQAYKEILIQYKAQFSKKPDRDDPLRHSKVEICDPKHFTPSKVRPENMTIEELLRKHMESQTSGFFPGSDAKSKDETALHTNFDTSFIEPF